MDVNRIESIAIPTALAGVAAGGAGFVSAKAIKNGEMTEKFTNYIADSFEKNDKKLMKTADKLDKINPFITDEDVIKLNGDREKVLAFADKKLKSAHAALEKFANKHAKALGIVPEEGQTMKDAVKAFLKDKDAAAVKEIFLPESTRRILENADYKKAIKDEFAEAFDSTKKQFKKGSEESAKFFKRAALNMKLKQAGVFAGLASGVALVSSAIASKISNS